MNWTRKMIETPPLRRKGPVAIVETWTSRGGPLAVTVKEKGDGRWEWAIVKDGASNPTASGLASSLNTAKRTVENFIQRSGYD